MLSISFLLTFLRSSPSVLSQNYKISEELLQKQLSRRELAHIDTLSEKKAVSLSCFKAYPFITLLEGNHLRACTNRLFDQAGIRPQIVLELETVSACVNFVRLGVGASIVSHFLLEDYINSFYVFQIKGTDTWRSGQLYYRKSAYLTCAMRHFIEMIK